MIIAEVGLNHLGFIHLAEMYINELAISEIDGITFQIREKEYYLNPEKARFKLYDEDYLKLAKLTKSKNKQFGIAIADIDKIDFLESIDTDFYKIIRNDITNTKLTKRLVATGKKIIVSTGLSSDSDIQAFMNNFSNKDNIVLNHTQLSYNIEDCNLLAIQKMKEKYNCNISYGSDCENSNTLYMSLCYNPSDILFYVKGYRNIKYPDDKHAIALNNIMTVSKNLKLLSSAIGKGIKQKMINKIEKVK